MKWNHLPQAGGLNDQKPELLDSFAFIFSQRDAEIARREAKEMQNADPKKQRSVSRPRGRRR